MTFEDTTASQSEQEEVMLVQLQRWASHNESDM